METRQRVAYDAVGERTKYEDICVGDDLGSMEWRFDETDIASLCESDDDFHEWYSVQSPYGGVIAPTLVNYPPVRLLFARKFNVRGLLYWYETENYMPLRPNVTYTITGRISDKWIKREREYVQYEACCLDPDGKEVFLTRRAHVLDFFTRDVPKAAEGRESGAGGRIKHNEK